ERAVQEAALRAAESGLLHSAHDCSDGGLAVALAECCFSSLNRDAIGADISLESKDKDSSSASDSRLQTLDSRLLFSESPSRIILSFDEAALGQVEEIAARLNCPFTILGRTGGNQLNIKADGEEIVRLPVAELETAWRTSLATKLRAEVLVAGAE